MADNDKQLDLKKRARRRLVGAVALAMLAAIVLPMVMDHEPRQSGPEIQIRIPSQEGANFASRAIQGPAPAKPKLPAQSAPAAEAASEADGPAAADVAAADPEAKPQALAKPESAESQPKPEKKPDTKPVAKTEPKLDAKPEPKHDDGARAAALLGEKVASDASYVVQLGVFKDAANAKTVRAEAKAAGYNSFVENVGDKTRVRAGPFESREAAEQAAQKLRKAGLSAVVQPRS
jgi:DedD protein